MIVLAVESSGLTASISVVTENEMLAEYTVNYKKTHSQTLLPMIDKIVKMLELNLESIDALAVTKGPGSFTGLRIGASTVKGLGLVLNKPVIGVPTVDAIAYNLYETDGIICPMMDAKRNEVYTGLYTFEDGRFTVLEEQKAVSIVDIADAVNQYKKNVIFLGDGADAYKDKLNELIKVPHTFAPPHLSRQRAGALGMLAVQYLKEGKHETAAEFKPIYLRLSQAERELLAKKSGK